MSIAVPALLRVWQGVTWSDGEPFAVQDVAFTIGLAKVKVVGSSTWDHVTETSATVELLSPTEAPGARGAAGIARHRIGLPEREGVGER